jgi:hypothetical protein
MSLAFLLDENVPGRVVRAIQRHNLLGDLHLDAVRVGDIAFDRTVRVARPGRIYSMNATQR